MFDEFWVQVVDTTSSLIRWIKENTIGKFTVLSAVILFFIQVGILKTLSDFIISSVFAVWNWLNLNWNNVPVYVWVILVGWLLINSISLFFHTVLLNFVTGVFVDNFNKGLGKWEYGNDGWKIEKDNGVNVLSVQDSDFGGITKRGFNWSDYEFSFETKVINRCSGWIVRAENRSKYFMLQLNLDESDKPRLRPHLRIDVSGAPWMVYEHLSIDLTKRALSKPIKLMEWIKVKLIVRSGEIDTYLNGEHAFHISLPDPINYSKSGKVLKMKNGNEEEIRELASISYPVGRVGFRCSGLSAEHSHFRKVRVKPLTT